MTYKSMRPKYSEDKSEKSTEKNRQKLFLILSIISFIIVGALIPFYIFPSSFYPYIDTTDNAVDVFVLGDFAYVANSESGLAIIDVSDPLNPGIPVHVNTTDNAVDVFVSGDFAYVANSESGLAIVNVSNPLNPGAPIYLDTEGWVKGVFVSDDYVYMAVSESGLGIVNASDPLNPEPPVYIDTTGYALNVFVSGDFAYVANSESGLAIVNVSNPLNPGIPLYDETPNANDVFISGDYAYITAGPSRLGIVNISDPLNPEPPIYLNTKDIAGVFVSGDMVFVADGSSGMAIIDTSEIFDKMVAYDLEQRILLVGLIISTVFGIIFSLMTVHENLKEKEFNSIGNLLLGLFLLYFFFFGYVSNVYDKNPGDNLLFIFKSFFDPYVKTDNQELVNLFVVGTGHVEYLKFELKYPISLGLLIFIGIGTLQGYRENFLVYSIKRNLWTIPFVILLSIIWHGINFQTDFYYALGEYFASGLGYLNIIILELIFVGSGILGGFLKSLRFNRLKQQHQELFLTDTNLREMK